MRTARGRRGFTPALALHALTPLYDRLASLMGFGEPFAARVAGALALRGDESVLDVGCGTGIVLAALAARHPGARLTGIDADPGMLERAAARTALGIPLRLILAYAQALPFRAGTFDAAVSTLIFHHLPTDVKRTALAEIARVLKPGGGFLLADFGRPETALQQVLLTAGSLFDGRANTRANLSGMMPALLADAGFTVSEVAPRYRAVQFLRAVRPFP
ncbi:MAG TPA: class I SAM-dependent methyltransferase [bacterium]|nr:class I SAM-dependent methyltransferase [bacterium]